MKVEKDKIPNNLFNHNKNFIPKPRPLSKRDNKMNLLLFNRHHKNNLIKISEKEQIEFNKQKIKFIKIKRPKSQKEESKDIKLPRIELRNKGKKYSIKENHKKIKIKSNSNQKAQTEQNISKEKKKCERKKNKNKTKNKFRYK